MSPPGNGEPTPPDFRDLASRITRTRNEFGRVYDEVRAAVPGSRPFIAIAGGATSDQIAFERALRQAHEERWYAQLGERLVLDGFLPDKSAVVTDLQALISVALGFPDASVVEAGGLRARSRLCRVEVADDANPQAITGTGFLVGPSTVLTAFHVVASLVDATNVPRPGSARRLSVRFDHATGRRASSSYNVPESWLVSCSPPHPAEVAALQGVAPVAPVAAVGPVDLSGHLDYAVIIVAGSPGSERGYYDVERAVQPVVDGTIHLFQHPMGVQQRQTIGVFTSYRDPPAVERIDHTANAVTGSSGGLLLDGSYALVGLHQGAHGSPVVNTGISALAIRDHLRAGGANLLDATYVQRFRVADDSRPILGRTRCQEWIGRSAKPLVRVKPLSGSKGVSFTLDIMRACLPESEHVIKRVQVRELESDAMRTAGMLLSRLDLDAVGLPTEADANTSRGAWLGQLVASFGLRVEQGHRDRMVWLVIDDLEKSDHPVPNGSVRDFLSELYKQSTTITNLRIVLLGMVDFPSGFPTGFVDDEDIAPPQTTEIESYLRLRLTAGGIDHSKAEVERIAELINLTAGMEIQPLSDYIADKVDRVINKAIEART